MNTSDSPVSVSQPCKLFTGACNEQQHLTWVNSQPVCHEPQDPVSVSQPSMQWTWRPSFSLEPVMNGSVSSGWTHTSVSQPSMPWTSRTSSSLEPVMNSSVSSANTHQCQSTQYAMNPKTPAVKYAMNSSVLPGWTYMSVLVNLVRHEPNDPSCKACNEHQCLTCTNTQDGVSQHGAQWIWKRISSHLPSFLFCTRACCEQKYFPEWLHSLPLVNLVCNDWRHTHIPYPIPQPSLQPCFPRPPSPSPPPAPANVWYQRLFRFTCNKSAVSLLESGEQCCIKAIDYSCPPFSLGKLMLTRSSSSSRLTMPWWPFRHATDSGVVCVEKKGHHHMKLHCGLQKKKKKRT